jgi:thermitase
VYRWIIRLSVISGLLLLALLPVFVQARAQDGSERQRAYSGLPAPIALWMPGGVAPYTHTIDAPPQHGTLESTSDTVVFYTSTAGYTGPDAFTYTLTDSAGASRTATVELTVLAAPPTLPLESAAGGAASLDTPPASETVPGEYILHYRPGTPRADVEALVAASGGMIVRDLPQLNAVVIQVPDGGMAGALTADYEVVLLEANRLRYPVATTPDDYDGVIQWGLNNIHAPDAWDVTLGTGSVIAVLDTGVDRDHPDLKAHLLAGYDFVSNDSIPQDQSTNSHGTHVTGIANAATNNGTGIAGVAWDARTIPVRVTGPLGATSDDIAAGIIYATDHGAQVINLSLGGTGWIKIEQDAVNYAAAHGVVVVAAAGNNGAELVFYPASYDHVISVASTRPDNALAYYSNYGLYIDIAAPGGSNTQPSGNIYSTINNGNYGYLAGTSMASPHVAGVAALVWSAGHATTRQEVVEAVLCSAFDLGTGGWDPYYGWGLLEAHAAVTYIPGTNPCLPVVPHDDFDTPRDIDVYEEGPVYTDTVDTTYATGWIDDPVPCAGEDTRTVWYRYAPERGGTLSVDTFGSEYDTVLAVYTGTRGSLTQIACNNDASGTDSALAFIANVDKTYYVAVSSLRHEGYDGLLTLNATFEPFPPPGCYPIELEPGQTAVLCGSD